MVRPDGGIGRRNGLKIRCPKRTCGFDPRSGYHDIQKLATFYLTENPLQRPNGMILLVSSRYLLITRILGYFWDIKSKSVAVGKFRQNDHKTIFPKKIFGSKKERDKTNPVCGKPPLAGSFKKVPIQKLIIKIFTDLPVLGTEPIKKRPLLDCLGDFPLIYLIGNIINFVKLKW